MAKISTINHEILRWARETAGFELEEVISDFKKITEWEKGVDYPTYPQLERLASKYKRPLALFFFPEIPDEERIESSFRTLPNLQISLLPPAIKLMLRKGKVFQLNLHELTLSKNPAQSLITDALYFSDKSNVEQMVKVTREFLGVDLAEQKKWQNPVSALKKWRDVLAGKGIFVFKDAFGCDDYSGFCLYDDVFPIIFLNNSLYETRQIFTLFHELAHLIFRINHLDTTTADAELDYLKNLSSKHRRIEQLCNKFSAEFLVPTIDFSKEVSNHGISSKSIPKLAKIYGVSREVILRRLFDEKRITKDDYRKQVAVITSRYRKKPDKPGGSFYRTRSAYLGDAYIRIVMTKYSAQEISISEASDYLNIRPKNFEQMETNFFSKP